MLTIDQANDILQRLGYSKRISDPNEAVGTFLYDVLNEIISRIESLK